MRPPERAHPPAPPGPELPSTPLGRSGVRVTRLSFGAAALGNLYTPVGPDEAAAAVDAAWDAGIRYFDTAPHYGLGLSEERLGAALHGRARDAYVLSTKVGRLLRPGPPPPAPGGSPPAGDDLAHGFAVPADRHRVWDFSADGVRRSIEESLRRLGLDRIDVAYLHDPDEHAGQALTEAYPALERLRAEGVLGAVGVGMNQSALPARFLRETDVDAVLLAGRYTLLEHEGAAELLPEAAARGRSVVIGGVFNSGLLADPRPGATFHYRPAPPRVLERAQRMSAVAERYGVPLRAVALHFPYGHEAVASVLAGGRSAAEVRDAAALLRTEVPADLWRELTAESLLPAGARTPNGPLPQGG